MEKGLKTIRTIAILLIVILISVIAFGGLYLKSNGIWTNVLPEFNYGMELSGIRELRFVLDNTEEEKQVYVDEEGNILGEVKEEAETISLDTNENTTEESNENTANETENQNTVSENTTSESTDVATEKEIDTEPQYAKETRVIKANNDEDINIENFEKTKRIIQDRLESIVGYEYNIRMNTITGELVVELPDDDNIELEESLITTIGKFEIIDSQTGIILMNNSDLKSADVLTSTANSGYQAYLHLRFNDSGTEKLKEISKEYVTTTDAAGTETTKNVTARLDGQDIITTYFGEEITNGEMQIPMGDLVTDYSQYLDNESRIARVADIISSETMPLAYQLSSDNYIKSSITDNIKLIAEIAFAVIILIVTIYMTIKFKLKKGFKKAIFDIGYIAILLLVLRYTNVNITLNSLIAFIAVIAINYVFSIKLLSAGNDSKAVFANTIKELYLMIIPVCIIAIIFTFMSSLVISSVGMVLFWGLFIQAVYNALLILVLDVV